MTRIIELLETLLQVVLSWDQDLKTMVELAQNRPLVKEEEVYLDNADMYQRFKFGRTKLYHLKKAGILKTYSFGGKEYFRESEVLAALKPPKKEE